MRSGRQKNGQPCNIYFRRAVLTQADGAKKNGRRMWVPDGENMLLEQRIFGTYEKFNSNSGWSSGNGKLLDFFSHWSWVHSGGEYLVCDLQGHKGTPDGPKFGDEENYFLLTDPVVLSRTEKFGCTDLGQRGIENWFAAHKCNELCRKNGIRSLLPHCRAQFSNTRCTSYR